MKIYVKRLNACLQRRYNIDRYVDYFKRCGHEIVDRPEDSDKIFVWSCSFRQDYGDNSVRIIRELGEKYGRDKMVVCGCLPGINEAHLKENYDGKYFKWADEDASMDKMIGAGQRLRLENVSPIVGEKNFTDNIDDYRIKNPDKAVSYFDQFIKLNISEGCDYNCSYCSEKLAFPPYRSFELSDIVAKCRDIRNETGYDKVILIADSLGDYGKDIKSSLAELVEAIKALDDRLKIGLFNIHPTDVIRYYDYIFDNIKSGRIFHLTIPIQSASNKILKLMNRPYTKKDLVRVFSELKRMNFAECETHLIVGFPSETEEDFLETVDFMATYKPKYVMASAYMEAEWLPSAKISDQVSAADVKRRLHFLAERMKESGIICNYDDCEYFTDHVKKLCAN